ncbi:MAG TPA: hypothetical protein VLE70_01270 [Anaerolineae bacterium]|jgi:hypothetical protein|nr:hypothetical protein [Anaerolineae bacterium]
MLKGGIKLTLLMGPTIPVPVPQAVTDALDSVEVRHAAGERSGFQMTFKFSNDSILNTALLLMGEIGPIIRVVLVMTINGTPVVLSDGVITNHQVTPAIGSGQSTLRLTGEDLTAVMNQIDFTGIPYPAMPPSARVLVILAKYAIYGMIPLVIPELFMDVPIPVDRIPTHQGTDLAYIEQLAADVGYVFYIEPGPAPGTNTAYWGPEIKIGIPQPALNIDMDAHTNVESLSFQFDAQEQTLPVVYIQNQMTKIPIPIPVPNVNILNPPLGLISGIPSKIRPLENTANLSPMQAAARGIAEASRTADAVTGSGSLDMLRYGRGLQARGLVGVRGAGLPYNGLYFVQSVDTKLKRGEAKQSFQLKRNGLISTVPVVPT